jgi:YidC/Oxa1 family membrane protein insertase
MNQEYEKIGIEPVNKTLRTSLGTVVGLDELDSVCETVKQMLEHTSEYSKQIESTFKEHIYNIGRSAELCGRYIIKRLSK